MIWTTDTCGFGQHENCSMEVDSEFNFIRFVRKCPVHSNNSFSEILAENGRGPSNSLDEIIRNAPAGYD